MTIEEFIEKCQQRLLPSEPMARVKLLAKELAEGANENLWNARMRINTDHLTYVAAIHKNIKAYLQLRWNNDFPNWFTLISTHYLAWDSNEATVLDLTDKAFALLSETEPTTIFISYKRSESSAFALLLENRLSQKGLSPFLDKQLQAGDEWHGKLEEIIKSSDYFIIVLGKQTLKSAITLKEIEWALEYNSAIIPIWHNSFTFNAKKWPHIHPQIANVINRTHAIRVLEENPLLYDTAINELLNRFGISG